LLKERLRELRKEKSETQSEVAASMGVDRSTYGKYETGDSFPDIDKLMWLATYFNVTVDYILGISDSRVSNDTSPAKTQMSETSTTKVSLASRITEVLEDNSELLGFWNTLQQREDLQLLFKQTRNMSPRAIQQVIRVIKAIEEEEDKEEI
jgi:transcriptional regulator with XRE-family HTH domain